MELKLVQLTAFGITHPYNLKSIRDKSVTLNGYFTIKPDAKAYKSYMRIYPVYGGGGGNRSFVSLCSLQSRRLLQLSLQSVFSIPLKTCIQHVFIVVIILLFFPSLVEAAGIEPASEDIVT